MKWSSLQWQPGDSRVPPQLGGAVVNSLRRALDPVLGAQLCLQRRLAELADFSLVWSFVVCFLAGGDLPPSMERPGLMAKVTPTGGTNPSSGQPFCSWFMILLDPQLHFICCLLETPSPKPKLQFHDMENTLNGTQAFLSMKAVLCSGRILGETRGSCFVL